LGLKGLVLTGEGLVLTGEKDLTGLVLTVLRGEVIDLYKGHIEKGVDQHWRHLLLLL
jgi:hypothetical protein